jgi:hypothetical protein
MMKPFAAISTRQDLARLLHVAPQEIDNLLARIDRFYRPKPIPKANGGMRILYIPLGRLRLAQDKIREHVFGILPIAKQLHGGVIGRSYITNAREHCGKDVLLKTDIKDYFPNIRPEKVITLYESFGFSGETSKILAMLTTYKHQLPQGSPTSTAIANFVLRRGDARMSGVSRQHGFTPTRFVDDIAISGSKRVADFKGLVTRIVSEEGFKTKEGMPIIMHKGESQTITGLSVNFRTSVPRAKKDAILKEAVATLKSGASVSPQLLGKVSSVRAANRNVAKRLWKSVKQRYRNSANTD